MQHVFAIAAQAFGSQFLAADLLANGKTSRLYRTLVYEQRRMTVERAMDLTASILAAAGVPPPSGYRPEGVDLIALLQKGTIAERTLYWRMPPAPGATATPPATTASSASAASRCSSPSA